MEVYCCTVLLLYFVVRCGIKATVAAVALPTKVWPLGSGGGVWHET